MKNDFSKTVEFKDIENNNKPEGTNNSGGENTTTTSDTNKNTTTITSNEEMLYDLFDKIQEVTSICFFIFLFDDWLTFEFIKAIKEKPDDLITAIEKCTIEVCIKIIMTF